MSSITTRSYLLGTIIGLIPECLFNVLGGYLIKHEVILLSAPETRSWQAAIIGAFILLLLLVSILLRVRQNHRKKFKTLWGIPFESQSNQLQKKGKLFVKIGASSFRSISTAALLYAATIQFLYSSISND